MTVLTIWLGLRADLMMGDPHPMFLIRGGLLLLLGGGCGWAVLNMANPGVGEQGQAWKMAIAAAALLPLAALVLAFHGQTAVAMANVRSGLECLLYSSVTALAVAAPILVWLRRGAPTSPARAGWLTGVAAGGLGAFVYGLHCPFNDAVYVGFYYSLTVGLSAILGRILVPTLIRW
ncbi:MAG: DUF1109 domain-containing protein [Sphingopyxis sp.]|nr:DUF1109 domain-containing protein [Sphingopyxis sp.]